MIIGVLGDIHGNYLAFKNVLKDISNEGINHLFITGDIVGYYYHSNEILEELTSWSYDIVQGNHDRILSEIYSGNEELRIWYKNKYGNGIESALNQLTSEQCNFLANLPVKKEFIVNDKRIMLSHGSPRNQDEYIYPNAPKEIFLNCADNKYDLIIMGHTHYPMIKYIKSTIFLNPGSVGQPRNYIQGANWAILDLKKFRVQLKHSSYDINTVVAEAKIKDKEHKYVANVLLRERQNVVRYKE